MEFHLLEARDALRRVLALHIQRVVLAACLRAALDCAIDGCATFKVDSVVVRRRAIAARDGLDRGIGNIHGIVRCLSRSLAADEVGVEVFLNGDSVARRLAARHIGIAAVNCTRDICGTAHFDFVQRTVLLLICRNIRARTARPAAIHIRMHTARNAKDIVRRRVSNNRTTAPRIRNAALCNRCRLRCIPELIAFVIDRLIVGRLFKDELTVCNCLDPAILTIPN